MSQSGTMLCDNAGDSADYYGLGSGDLCIPYYRAHDNTWGYVWGDSFSGQNQSGTWMTPAMLCQASFDASGNTPIAFTWAEPSPPAQQLFNYTHNADNGFGFEVTRIPNDCIEIGGRTYIAYTSVNTWVGPFSTDDGSLMSGIAYSDDYGQTWQDQGWHWAGAHGNFNGGPINGSLYMQWSFAGVDADNWLYVYSKCWNGSHNFILDGGNMQLFRIQTGDFYNGNFGAQWNWANVGGTWQWTQAQAPTSMNFSSGPIGEHSVKLIGNTWVMSYLDCTAGAIRTRTASSVTGPWSAPKSQVTSSQLANLYGGYIHPGSQSTSNLTLIISSWNGTVGAYPYTATQWTGLTA